MACRCSLRLGCWVVCTFGALITLIVGIAIFVPREQVRRTWLKTNCTVTNAEMISDTCCSNCYPRIQTCKCTHATSSTNRNCYYCDVSLRVGKSSTAQKMKPYPITEAAFTDYPDAKEFCDPIVNRFKSNPTAQVTCWADPHGDGVSLDVDVAASAVNVFIIGWVLFIVIGICLPLFNWKNRRCQEQNRETRAQMEADYAEAQRQVAVESIEAETDTGEEEGDGSTNSHHSPPHGNTPVANEDLPPAYSEVVRTAPTPIVGPIPLHVIRDASVRDSGSSSSPGSPATTPTGSASTDRNSVLRGGASGGNATGGVSGASSAASKRSPVPRIQPVRPVSLARTGGSNPASPSAAALPSPGLPPSYRAAMGTAPTPAVAATTTATTPTLPTADGATTTNTDGGTATTSTTTAPVAPAATTGPSAAGTEAVLQMPSRERPVSEAGASRPPSYRSSLTRDMIVDYSPAVRPPAPNTSAVGAVGGGGGGNAGAAGARPVAAITTTTTVTPVAPNAGLNIAMAASPDAPTRDMDVNSEPVSRSITPPDVRDVQPSSVPTTPTAPAANDLRLEADSPVPESEIQPDTARTL